jgi:hypothetical protein
VDDFGAIVEYIKEIMICEMRSRYRRRVSYCESR